MKIKLFKYLLPTFLGLCIPAPGFLQAQEENASNFGNLIRSMPMAAVLFFDNDPGNLSEPFLQVSRTPRFRFAEIQFIKADIKQPGVAEELTKLGIENEDLPIIVLYRDGQIVSDKDGKVLGLSQEATDEELRDFIDDYFSDLIEGVIKYSQQDASQFASIPTEQVLFADYAPDFQPAVIYQPIVFTVYTTWVQPIWWTSFHRSSFFHRYYAGFRPVFRAGNLPRWFRPNRPDRWDRWRNWRDNRPGNRPNRPNRPERPGEERPNRPNRPNRPERPGEERPNRPNRPERPVEERPNRPARPEVRPGVERPNRASRPETRPEGRTGRSNRSEVRTQQSRDRSNRSELRTQQGRDRSNRTGARTDGRSGRSRRSADDT